METPVWFGRPGVPLLGWLDAPDDGQARAGVVLCPALLGEHVNAYRSFRRLSEALVARDCAVLRFDYESTGDSAGRDEGDGRVAAWQDSVVAAVELLRARGVEQVAVVGLRIGATLAAVTSPRTSPQALVLWDPCVSGRAFLREQRALMSFGVGDQTDLDGVTRAGGDGGLAAGTEEELAQLTMLDVAPDATRPTLVLARENRPVPRALRERFAHASWRPASDQAAMLEVSSVLARSPEPAIAEIVDWLDATLAADRHTLDVSSAPEATIGVAADGTPVLERVARLGAHGLVGLVTAPVGAPRTGTTVVFLNLAAERHTGPERAWVDLSRLLAPQGLRCLRFDLSGMGDSPTPPGQPEDDAYPRVAVADVIEAVGAVADDPRDVVLVGVCSGAIHALEGAAALRARGVVAINPPVEHERPAADDAAGTRGRVTGSSPGWVRGLGNTRLLAKLESRIPDPFWWFLHKVRLVRSPAAGIGMLVAAGTGTYLMCGPAEIRPFRERSGTQLRSLGRSEQFRLDVVEGLDHSLLRREPRDRALALLLEHLASRYAPAPV